ncbi:hypothetical protein A9Z42_0051610 [Trichoderma parareesei]|uniref:Uncharacterized protein n=1 Tax=Trichoderma parareesei TaxID=858221 RepID=A0A2H2ZN18_TRIPA|nr:hypothetical protein A9Z42_0051610 [Trichoderma parareesei]
MALATSPAHDVAKLLGRRNISTIPKDQKSLLERKDSWAVDQDGTKGMATVPKQVLQTLKEAFIRLQGETEKENSEGEEEEDEEEEDEEDEENPKLPRLSATNERGRQNGHLPGSTAARPSSPPPSSPEVPISSWSESPALSRGRSREQDAMSDADAPDKTPGSPMHMAVPEVLSQPLFHATPNPSALSEPEDLEMELPQAHEAREAPINRMATVLRPVAATQEPASLVTSLPSTTDTPPCAQPQAATSSGTPKSSVVKATAAHGRSRRMKPIAFSDDNSPKAAGSAPNPSPFTRRPSMRSLPRSNVDNSLYSSSDTPAPYERERAERFPSPPPPPPPPHNFTRSATTQHGTYGQLDGAVSREISPSRETPMHQLYRIQAAVNVSISDRVAPYRAFTTTYPDYTTVHSGNLLSFIQACVYLRMLQEERRMREYLYDDFIRAWSSGFLPYVQNAGPGQEPLPAVEWFNMLKGPILFNRMCVNASNIDVVLSAYPEEASRIKAILERSLQTEKSTEPEPEPEPEMLPGTEMDLELDTEPEPDSRPEPEPRQERRREPEVIDIVTSDGAMDITADVEPQTGRHPPPTPPPPPPPTRQAPSLPAPSRTAPPPPPRPASPELGSDDYFDTPPLPPKPPSSARLRPRSRSRSRSPSQSRQPSRAREAQDQPRPRPQTQLQPQRQLTLPQRQSPKRRQTASNPPAPASSAAAPPPPLSTSTTATPSKRPRPKSPDRLTTEQQQQQQYYGPGHAVPSSSRPMPSSNSTTTTNRPVPKLRKRTAEERARLKEHFRKKATSSSTSHVGSGLD